jgi:hypothetical protein
MVGRVNNFAGWCQFTVINPDVIPEEQGSTIVHTQKQGFWGLYQAPE